MASVEGRTVVVFGATGNVGHGAARAFLDAGAKVLAPTRTRSGSERLTAELGPGVVPVVGDISDPEDALRLRDRLAAHGPLDHVVASLGPWWQGGPLAGQAPEAWVRVRRMLLDGHVHAAALLLPALRVSDASSYTVVTGMGAHHVVPGTSLLHVAVNGVLGLSRVIRAESTTGPRVNELLIRARIEKAPRPGVVTSADFGPAVVALAEGAVRGEVVTFPSAAAGGW